MKNNSTGNRHQRRATKRTLQRSAHKHRVPSDGIISDSVNTVPNSSSSTEIGAGSKLPWWKDARKVFHPEAFAAMKQRIKEKNAKLVPRNYNIFSFTVFYHCGNSVRIGICSDYQVRTDFFSKVNSKIKTFRIFRIRADNCGEIAGYHHLLLHRIEMLDAQRRQRLRHQLVAAAVERCIDDAQIFRGIQNALTVDERCRHCLVAAAMERF